MAIKENTIYYGDCEHSLQTFPEGSIDLIYIDPPFFTQKFYDDPFKNGFAIKTFMDNWYDKSGKRGDMNCYLEYMEPRLEQMYRVLKPTGSFYLHCDYHANAHLRILLDRIFGARNFQNEIIWCYSVGGRSTSKRFGRKHDSIFFYTKGKTWTFNGEEVMVPRQTGTSSFGGRIIEEDGVKYQIKVSKRPDGTRKEYKYALSFGKVPEDWWMDINSIQSQSKERIGYPTQKPEALIERIIKASSNPMDLVLDPMMGGGTTPAVAQKLGRRWIGIDCSPNACRTTVDRMVELGVQIKYAEIINMPFSPPELKKMDAFEFERWAVHAYGGRSSGKMGADMGIDGYDFEMNPIQVKQQDRVGRNVVDNFETAIRRKKKQKGTIIAFSFTRTAHNEIARAKRDDGLEIQLITVEEILKRNGRYVNGSE